MAGSQNIIEAARELGEEPDWRQRVNPATEPPHPPPR